MEAVASSMIAGLAGVVEIISRYRDEPFKTLKAWPSLLFVLINAASGLIVLALLSWYGVLEPTTADEFNVPRVLAAGLGGAATLRSSLFKVRVGESDVPLGPGALLELILSSLDRSVDRQRARQRAEFISEHASDVDFDAVKISLPMYCLGLMQNVPDDESKRLAEEIAAVIEEPDLADHEKSKLLLLKLLNVVGEDVLSKALSQSRGDQEQ